MGEELFFLNMDLKRCAFLVKAEDLIGLRVKEVRKRELFGIGSHKELARLFRVLNYLSILKNDFGLIDSELVLINEHIEAVFREIFDLELVIFLMGIDQGDHSLGFVVDSADDTLGTVTGTKLDGYALRMTVSIRAKGSTQLMVRASAQYNLKAIEDPEPYQQFFASLSKAIFLTAQQVD